MYDPKDILTLQGQNEYYAHLQNIENGLFYILNHADDLHIGATDPKQERICDMYYEFVEWLPVLRNGDGELD